MTSPTVRRALSAIAGIALLGGAIGAVPIAAQAAPVFTFPNPFAVDPDDPADATIGRIALATDGSSTLDVSGEAPEGSTVTVSIEGTASGTAELCSFSVVADMEWWCTVPLTPFVGAIVAVARDAGGTEIGTISRPAVAVGAPALAADSQNVFTNDGLGTISASVEPLQPGAAATAYLYLEGDEVCGNAVGADGSWSCSYAIDGNPDGVFDVEVRQERTALGVTAISEPAQTTLTLDRVGPTAPGSFTTPSTATLRVTQPTYPLAGTAEPFATVRVLAGATPVCGPIAADAAGAWSCTASTPATDGDYTLTIQQTDAAGNAGTGVSPAVRLEMRRTVVITPPTINIPAPTPVIPITNIISLTVDASQLWINTTPLSPERREITRPLVFNAVTPVLYTGGAPFTMVYSSQQVTQIASTLTSSAAQLVNVGTLFTGKIRSEELVLDVQRAEPGQPVELTFDLPADFPPGDHTLVVSVAVDGYEEVEFTSPVEVIAGEEPQPAPEPEPEPKPEVLADASTDSGPAWWMWLAIAAVGAGILAAVIAMARTARRRA